ncbi:MAG TPA: alpha/beta fold hydrolase [Clostridiaceae bacterium]
MGVFDFPLEQLKEYRGSSPKPSDFDEYWERALAQMRAIDPKIELIPSDFQVENVECFDLYFTGVKQARIHAKYLRPKASKGKNGAVLKFHGYSVNAGDWQDKLSYVSAGFSVFALDCRGQGGSSEDRGSVKGNTLNGHIIRGLDDHEDNLLFRDIFLDTAQLASIAMSMPEVDENKVYAMGGSQGGGLTIACAALEPRISRLAPVYPFLSDYKRVWDMDLAKDAYQELQAYFRFFDPMHKREAEVFNKLGYIDIQNLASRIKGKVLFATGLMDTICPPSTQYAVYNKITSQKEHIIFPDYGHEWLPSFDDMTFQFFLD